MLRRILILERNVSVGIVVTQSTLQAVPTAQNLVKACFARKMMVEKEERRFRNEALLLKRVAQADLRTKQR